MDKFSAGGTHTFNFIKVFSLEKYPLYKAATILRLFTAYFRVLSRTLLVPFDLHVALWQRVNVLIIWISPESENGEYSSLVGVLPGMLIIPYSGKFLRGSIFVDFNFYNFVGPIFTVRRSSVKTGPLENWFAQEYFDVLPIHIIGVTISCNN